MNFFHLSANKLRIYLKIVYSGKSGNGQSGLGGLGNIMNLLQGTSGKSLLMSIAACVFKGFFR